MRSPARASEHRRGHEPPFLYRQSTEPQGVTGYCIAPYGAYILGDTIPTGVDTPAYTVVAG